MRTVLGRAGWEAIEISEVREPVYVGRGAWLADDADAFELTDPETAKDLATAEPAVAAQAVAELRAAFAARERPDGVWLAATAWLVQAYAG